jgi:hypothetical protein
LDCLVSPWMPNSTLHTYLESKHNDLTVLDRSRLVSRTIVRILLVPFKTQSKYWKLEDVSAGLCYCKFPILSGLGRLSK